MQIQGLMVLMRSFLEREKGTETVEWAVLVGFLIIIVAAGWDQLGAIVNIIMEKLLALFS